MNKRFAIFGASLATISAAQAAVPADVTTALADMKADGITVAVAVLVAAIAIGAIKFIRRAL